MNSGRLFAALLRRELDAFLVILVVAGTAGAVVAAPSAALAAPDMAGTVFDRLLARYDLSVLFVALGLVTVRAAIRPADDHTAQWLDPFCAAGGGRTTYGLLSAAAVCAAGLLLFIPAAIAFAVTAASNGGTAEPLRHLPAFLTGGAIQIACFSLFCTLLALALRNAAGSLLLSILLIAAPWVLLTRYVMRDGAVPTWLRHWFRATPPVTVPAGMKEIGGALLLAVVMATLLAIVSRTLAGRRA